jgi:formiminotetrahydrofolate cyclodeaminase
MLVNMKLTEFFAELASEAPAPGGGSVAALSGALSAGLICMVCRLSIGRKISFEAEEPEGVSLPH